MSLPVDLVHRVLRSAGVDLVRFPGRTTPIGRRMRILRSVGVDLVLDVGANTGQYGAELRGLGYRGRIVSFEPQSAAFEQLARRASRDPGWEPRRLALGSSPGVLQLNLAGNSVSSSFLDMLSAHASAAPSSRYQGAETVDVETLDDLWPGIAGAARRPMLKLDVQGFEQEVLRGAPTALGQMAMVQTELSLVPLYEGAPSATEVIDFLAGRDFIVASFEPGFEEPASGRLLQVDGIFVHRSVVEGG